MTERVFMKLVFAQGRAVGSGHEGTSDAEATSRTRTEAN